MRRWRFPLVICPLVAIVLGSGARAQTTEYEITSNQDLWFTVTDATNLTVRTDAQRFGIDSMLWLYDQNGILLVSADDSNGTLNSELIFEVTAGTYRLRAGIYPDPNLWRGGSYLLTANLSALEPTTTVPEVSSTTEVVDATTTSVFEEPSTTTEAPTTTSTQPVEITSTTSVEETTSTTALEEPTSTTSSAPSTTETPSTTTVNVPNVIPPEVLIPKVTVDPLVPEVIIPSSVPPVTDAIVVVSTDPAPSDGTEPPFTIGGDDHQENSVSVVSNGLRDGVTPEQQRVVVATSILTVMPVFKPKNPVGQASQKGRQKEKDSE